MAHKICFSGKDDTVFKNIHCVVFYGRKPHSCPISVDLTTRSSFKAAHYLQSKAGFFFSPIEERRRWRRIVT